MEQKTYKIKSSEDATQYLTQIENSNIFMHKPIPSFAPIDHKSKLISPAGDIVIYSKSHFNWLQRWFIHFFTGFKVEIKKD